MKGNLTRFELLEKAFNGDFKLTKQEAINAVILFAPEEAVVIDWRKKTIYIEVFSAIFTWSD